MPVRPGRDDPVRSPAPCRGRRCVLRVLHASAAASSARCRALLATIADTDAPSRLPLAPGWAPMWWRRRSAARLRPQQASAQQSADSGAYAFQCIQTALAVAHEGIALVPGIAGQDRGNHATDCRLLLFVEDDLLKTAGVPRFDEGAEGVDPFFQRHGVVVFPVDLLTGEHAVEGLGGQAGGLQSNRHAR